MTEIEELREKVKQKRKLEAEQLEKEKLKEELEKGTVRGLIKKGGMGLLKKLLK